jgi:hypothetical protein
MSPANLSRDASGEITPLLPKLVEQLHAAETDLRFGAANRLSDAAWRGQDIQVAIPALETLLEDEAVPSFNAKHNPVSTVWLSVGYKATCAVAHHYRHRCDGAALGRLIAAGGLVAARTLHALRATEDAEEIAMMMPLVSEQLSNGDDTVCRTAASLLTQYYFLTRQWDAIADLLDSNTEMVRRGALGTLDDLAEAADHRDYDLTPVAPALLRVFAREGPDYKKTRVAAARVLMWLILRQGKMSATSFVLNGIDLMGIAEVRAELRAIKRSAAKRGEG